jgi:hypothetical protein
MPFAPLQTINIGGYANDGTGDDLRTAFQKVNSNFATLNSELGITTAENVGSGVGIFAQKDDTTLQFKSLKGTSGVTVTYDATSVTIGALANIQGDNNPTLGGNLNLNGYSITGNGSIIIGVGDIQSTVWGIDIRQLQATLDQATSGNLDFGSFNAPAVFNYDFGSF